MTSDFSPINRLPKVRDFLVYDLEWLPGTYELRMVGVYDGKRYRHYTTIEHFLDSELTYTNRNKWFYAHAGGLADIQFIFEHVVLDPDWKVDAKFSGSSAVIVKLTRGKHSWYFVDSYWLLRESLRKIGKWVGIEKGGEDGDLSIFYGPLKALIPYNELDCVILWKAIAQFQAKVLALGGQLQMTLASTAMMLFRREYLDVEIPTSRGLNVTARRAYFASRVEPIRRRCGAAYLYDINSSFPHAMTYAVPGRLLTTQRHFPTHGGDMYMADVTVTVPDTYLPPLPYRTEDKSKVFFPVGTWRGWYMGADLELLMTSGGDIVRIHEVLTFEPFTGLRDYAEDLYGKRLETEDPAEKVVYKLLLNSLYGKFAESLIKQTLLIHPKHTTCQHKAMCVDEDGEENACLEQLMPGVWLQTEEKPIAHCHVPISAHITAVARRSLYQHMHTAIDQRAARGLPPDVAYCDTDSLVTAETLPTGDKLGELKLEQTLTGFHVLQPKVYRAEIVGQSEPKIRMKGFSRVTGEDFEALSEGWAVSIQRMTRVKELFRSKDVRPRDRDYLKRFRVDKNGEPVEQTKRKFLPDGDSRPWHVDEIT